jgi:hypothetical protein
MPNTNTVSEGGCESILPVIELQSVMYSRYVCSRSEQSFRYKSVTRHTFQKPACISLSLKTDFQWRFCIIAFLTSDYSTTWQQMFVFVLRRNMDVLHKIISKFSYRQRPVFYFLFYMDKPQISCRIWTSHSGGYEEYIFFSAYYSTQKIEAICSSETSVNLQRTTWRYIPGDRTIHK